MSSYKDLHNRKKCCGCICKWKNNPSGSDANSFLQIANLLLRQPAIPCAVMPPGINQTFNDSNQPIDSAFSLYASEAPVSPHIAEITCGASNDSNSAIADMGYDNRAGDEDPGSYLPPISVAAPQQKFPESDAHADFFAADQRVNMIADAAGRLTDAAAQIVELMNTKKHDDQKCDALLHFREWWELVEVHICVGGKIICGIPILIEEGAFRIINNNHSYFIPFEKVDYIQTNDGLRSSFQSEEDQQISTPS